MESDYAAAALLRERAVAALRRRRRAHAALLRRTAARLAAFLGAVLPDALWAAVGAGERPALSVFDGAPRALLDSAGVDALPPALYALSSE